MITYLSNDTFLKLDLIFVVQYMYIVYQIENKLKIFLMDKLRQYS